MNVLVKIIIFICYFKFLTFRNGKGLLGAKRKANGNKSNGSADKNKAKSRKYDENYLFWDSHVFL